MINKKQKVHYSSGFHLVELGIGLGVLALGGLLGYIGVVQFERYSEQQKAAVIAQRMADDVAFVKQRLERYIMDTDKTRQAGALVIWELDAYKELSRSATGPLKKRLERGDRFGKGGAYCTYRDDFDSIDQLSYKLVTSNERGAEVEVGALSGDGTGDLTLFSIKRDGDSRAIADISCSSIININDFDIKPGDTPGVWIGTGRDEQP